MVNNYKGREYSVSVASDVKVLSSRFPLITCALSFSAPAVATRYEAMGFGLVVILSLGLGISHPNFLSSVHLCLLDVCSFRLLLFPTIFVILSSGVDHVQFHNHHFHKIFGTILHCYEEQLGTYSFG